MEKRIGMSILLTVLFYVSTINTSFLNNIIITTDIPNLIYVLLATVFGYSLYISEHILYINKMIINFPSKLYLNYESSKKKKIVITNGQFLIFLAVYINLITGSMGYFFYPIIANNILLATILTLSFSIYTLYSNFQTIKEEYNNAIQN
jgi:hypothetical protein